MDGKTFFLSVLNIILYMLKTGCSGLHGVQFPTSWQNASKICQRNASKLACITESNAHALVKHSVKSAWVNDFITFSDWTKYHGCYPPIRSSSEKISSKIMNIGTCQLACRNHTLFGLKEEKCICFENSSLIMKEDKINCNGSAIHMYEKVNDPQVVSSSSWDMTNSSSTLYCNTKNPVGRYLPVDITSCHCNKGKIIAICSYVLAQDGVPDRCISFWQFRDNTDVTRDIDLNCTLFNITHVGTAEARNIIRVGFHGSEARHLGYTSSGMVDKDEQRFPILACTNVKIIEVDGHSEARFSRSTTCDENQLDYFICDDKRQGPCDIENFNFSSTYPTITPAGNTDAIEAIIIAACTVVALIVLIGGLVKICRHKKNPNRGKSTRKQNDGISYDCSHIENDKQHETNALPYSNIELNGKDCCENVLDFIPQTDNHKNYFVLERNFQKSNASVSEEPKRVNGLATNVETESCVYHISHSNARKPIQQKKGSANFCFDDKQNTGLIIAGTSCVDTYLYAKPKLSKTQGQAEIIDKTEIETHYMDPKDGIYDHLNRSHERRLSVRAMKNIYEPTNHMGIENKHKDKK